MKLNQKQREITRAFRHVFVDHPDGQKVIDYLIEEFLHAPISDESEIKMAQDVGAHNLVTHIINILQRREDDEDADI